MGGAYPVKSSRQLITEHQQINLQYFTEDYVLPDTEIMQQLHAQPWTDVPIIDLSGQSDPVHRHRIQAEVMRACQYYGMFQIVNHKVETAAENALRAAYAFFNLPREKLAEYRRMNMERFLVNTRLEGQLLGYIAQGLGLNGTFFQEELRTACTTLMVDRYPQCPNPSLTCGLPGHCDADLITITNESGAYGLQIYVDGDWKLVVPHPRALLVTLGGPMQVISNGRLKAAFLRVVVNVIP